METYSRIGLVRSYGYLQSYWTSTKRWKLTVVLDLYEAMFAIFQKSQDAIDDEECDEYMAKYGPNGSTSPLGSSVVFQH